jgi:4-amino-4-deoxy-L-arabinose transferase-like glycosyltransferase
MAVSADVKSRILIVILLLLICLVSLLRGFNSSNTSATFDEPIHIAIGMEWLDRGTYNFEYLHPPLARVAVALPLYLSGHRLSKEAYQAKCPQFAEYLKRYHSTEDKVQKGMALQLLLTECLHKADRSLIYRDVSGALSLGAYQENMKLARLGILPFLIAAILGTFAVGSILYSRTIGVISAAVFSLIPSVIAHGSLATTDMAFVATFIWSIFFTIRALAQPSTKNAILLGVALGLCVGSKFSALLFLPVTMLLLCLVYSTKLSKNHLKVLPYVVISGFLILWVLYRFSIGATADSFYFSLNGGEEPHPLLQLDILPMPEFWNGIQQLAMKAAKGHGGYLFGATDQDKGLWYFFPVALFFKTPIFVLLTLAIGGFYCLREYAQKRNRQALLPVALIVIILFCASLSSINIGTRHVLIVYPFIAIISAIATMHLYEKRKVLGLILLIGVGLDSAMAHPGYLSYFNPLAGDNPQEILVDSDLDWGQDALNLAREVKLRKITRITVCGVNAFPIGQVENWPVEVTYDCPQKQPEGFFAVGYTTLLFSKAEDLQWLNGIKPAFKVGDSLVVYNLD